MASAARRRLRRARFGRGAPAPGGVRSWSCVFTRLVAALALVVLVPVRALAAPPQRNGAESSQPGSAAAAAEAKQHFDRARESYRNGAYREAIAELEHALALDPEGKDLEYNLGLIYEKLGEIDNAIVHFKRYVELETDATERERAESTIRRLEGARHEVATAPPTRSTATRPESKPAARPASIERAPPVERRERGRADGWVVGAGGVAVAAAVVGAVFGIRALVLQPKENDSTSSTETYDDLRQRQQSAHSSAVVADIAFAIGIAAGVLGVTLYFTRDSVVQRSNPTATSSSAALLIGGRF